MTDAQRQVLDTICRTVLSLPSGRPLLIGIDGKDASGKTTFANTLADVLESKSDRKIIRVSLDDFFNPRAVRSRQNDQARGCYEDTFDLAKIKTHLLEPLRTTGMYTTKIFDYETDTAVELAKQSAPNDAIVIVDGVFLKRPEFREYWDYTVLLEVSDETAIERGAARDSGRIGDIESARQKYINRYIASQKIYFDECNPKERATIVVDNTDFDNPVIL